jgi:hypothetical protein
VLADIDENNLYFLYRHLRHLYPELRVDAQVVDIRDAARVEQLLRDCRAQDLIHAAAHKHVPLMEYAPEEAVKNNVIGCLNVITAADRLGVERFVLVSTDKAVNPASVMGATKRAAELLVQQRAATSKTRFSTVRFGNVLGSAGSVVPLFKEQIARGGPVTVTHPECRRYLDDDSRGGRPGAARRPRRARGTADPRDGRADPDPGSRTHDDLALGPRPRRRHPDRDHRAAAGREARRAADDGREAAHSREVRPKVRAVESAPPPPDLLERIEKLQADAAVGDREAVIAALRGVVPAYTPATVRRAGRGRPHSQRIALTGHAELAPIVATGAERARDAEPQRAGGPEIEAPSRASRGGGRRALLRRGPRSAATPRRAPGRGRDART